MIKFEFGRKAGIVILMYVITQLKYVPKFDIITRGNRKIHHIELKFNSIR